MSGGPYPMRNQEDRARRAARRAHDAAGAPLDALVVRPGWADAVTAAGLGAALASSSVTASGRRGSRWWSTGLWALASAADALDGALARRGGGGPHGALLDSCADRVADAAVCAGVVVRELRGGRRAGAGLAAVAGLAGALPSYVSASARASGLDPGGAGPGRLVRCAAWALVLAAPAVTGPVAAGVTVGSMVAALRRYRTAVGPGPVRSDTGPVTALTGDAP